MAVRFPNQHVVDDEGSGSGAHALVAVRLTSRRVECIAFDVRAHPFAAGTGFNKPIGTYDSAAPAYDFALYATFDEAILGDGNGRTVVPGSVEYRLAWNPFFASETLIADFIDPPSAETRDFGNPSPVGPFSTSPGRRITNIEGELVVAISANSDYAGSTGT